MADIGDTHLYYEMAGEGVPVILIHAHSMDLRMWDPQFMELAKHYKVVRYDMRGYGLSDMPVEGQNFLHVDDLHKLMHYLGIEKTHIVGLSLGSFVCVDSLVLYPEQTLSITVASGGIRDTLVPDNATPEQRAVAQVKARQEKLASIETVRKQGVGAFKKEWLDHMVKDCGPYGERIRPKLRQMIEDWSAWQVLHVESPWELDPPVAVQIKTNKPDIPVLVLIGEDDTEGSHNSSEYLAQIVPNARKCYLKDAGHFSNIETPTAFNRVLTEFLKSISVLPEATKANVYDSHTVSVIHSKVFFFAKLWDLSLSTNSIKH